MTQKIIDAAHGGEIVAETSGYDSRGAYLYVTSADGGGRCHGYVWLSTDETRALRDTLTEIIGDVPKDPTPETEAPQAFRVVTDGNSAAAGIWHEFPVGTVVYDLGHSSPYGGRDGKEARLYGTDPASEAAYAMRDTGGKVATQWLTAQDVEPVEAPRYRVGPNPTYADGEPHDYYTEGDVVTLRRSEPDSQGDVATADGYWIALADLTLVEAEDAPEPTGAPRVGDRVLDADAIKALPAGTVLRDGDGDTIEVLDGGRVVCEWNLGVSRTVEDYVDGFGEGLREGRVYIDALPEDGDTEDYAPRLAASVKAAEFLAEQGIEPSAAGIVMLAEFLLADEEV